MCKYLLVLFYVFCFYGIQAENELGDPCPAGNGKGGICDYVNNCDYYKKKIYEDQNLIDIEYCSFAGNTPILCCPDGDQSQLNGPFRGLFRNWDIDEITGEHLTCRYKGVSPMICCPKTPDYPPLEELPGCPPFQPVQTPNFKNLAHRVAWRKCVENRQIVEMCLEDQRSLNGFSRTNYCNIDDYIGDVDRITTDNPANSVARAKEFPHMAVLGCNNNPDRDTTGEPDVDIVWIGAGSLISDRYILTAAHVLADNNFGPLRYALLGVVNKTDILNGDLYYIVRHITFDTYVSSEQHDDIALLELNVQVKFSEFVYPICLPVSGIQYDSTDRVIAGWGRTHKDKPASQVLLKAAISVLDPNLCVNSIKKKNFTWNYTTMMCARGPLIGRQYSDTCTGDSGGPLMAKVENPEFSCNYVITGVVSFGLKCGTGNPGVYTNVVPYLDWIINKVWPPNINYKSLD